MKNIKLLVGFLLVTVITAHSMDQMVNHASGLWYSLPTDIKTGIVARTTIEDKKNLRLINKDLAFVASKANFANMINYSPCILDRAHHLEFMINYSLQRDEQAQNVMTWLIKNAHLCGHADVLDIVPHFFPAMSESNRSDLVNALENRDFSLIIKDDNLYGVISICTQIYKKNQNKSLSKFVMPGIMDVYGGYETAINRYLKKYRQEEESTAHLHIAVENDHNTIAELFITQNPNLLCITDANGMIPLAIAAQKNNVEIIKMFQKCSKRNKIETKIDIPFEKSPHFFAAQAGHEQCLQQLLTQDDFVGSFSSKPLHVAVANGHLQTVEMLLARSDTDINAKGEAGFTAMHLSIRAAAHNNNNIPLLQLLITKGALLNEKDAGGSTPLMLAVQIEALEVAKLLVKQPHIDIDAYVDPNLELLQKGSLNINEKILTQIKICKGLSTLCSAASLGNAAMVQLLLDNGAALYNNYRTPLMLAAQNGHYNIVKKLVDHSPHNINDTNDEGFTALFSAIGAKRKDIVEFLLDNGALLNVEALGNINMTQLKMSPLLFAVNIGDLAIVKLLVERGADINYEAMHDMPVIGLAIFKGHKDIIDFLRNQPNIIIK